MTKKYKLTNETKEFSGRTLYRIEALVSFGNVSAGDLGGFVECEQNLSHDGDAWVSDDAQVYGKASVYGKAQVYNNAWVFGNAQVFRDARVYGNAHVSGNAQVSGDAEVSPIHIQGLYWPVTISDNCMVIGCEHHALSEWDKFDDRKILEMDGKNALKFWRSYGEMILSMARASGRKF